MDFLPCVVVRTRHAGTYTRSAKPNNVEEIGENDVHIGIDVPNLPLRKGDDISRLCLYGVEEHCPDWGNGENVVKSSPPNERSTHL